MNNLVRVSWGDAMTDYFTALDGVKQSAVLSPILYCVYVDDLLLRLSKAGVGCFICLHFVGALAYAVDLVLLVPTASAMRRPHAKVNDCIFYIDGRMIDLVQLFSHLGHLIISYSDDGEVITIRKNSCIGQVNNTFVILANYLPLLNIIYFMHTVLVFMDVSYGRYQIVTLKSLVLLGGRV